MIFKRHVQGETISNMEEEFIILCREGLNICIKLLMDSGVDVHYKDDEGLKGAIENNRFETVKLLVETCNYDLNYVTDLTINSYSHIRGAILKYLISMGASLDKIDKARLETLFRIYPQSVNDWVDNVPSILENYDLEKLIDLDSGFIQTWCYLHNYESNPFKPHLHKLRERTILNILHCTSYDNNIILLDYIDECHYKDILRIYALRYNMKMTNHLLSLGLKINYLALLRDDNEHGRVEYLIKHIGIDDDMRFACLDYLDSEGLNGSNLYRLLNN